MSTPITVTNAAGEPDTTAEILINNQLSEAPKISVIIPVYNVEPYLPECLDSIINQTLKEIEIICVDDGSTDNSLTILKAYAAKDKRITIITQQNRGAGPARNAGLAVAGGEFIGFMDPDDYYPDNTTLNMVYSQAQKNEALICGGEVMRLQDNQISRFKEKEYYFDHNGFIEYKEYQFDYGYWRFIYNRVFLKENQLYFPSYLRGQDPPFFIRAMITAGRFYTLNTPTYIYRTSYKKTQWNVKKAADYLCCLRDSLQLAQNNNLQTLYKTVLKRLNSAYCLNAIYVPYRDEPAIHRLVNEIKDIISQSPLAKAERFLRYTNPEMPTAELLRNLNQTTCRQYLFGFIPFLKKIES